MKGGDRNLEASQTERQRKTEENVDRRPVVAPGAGVRWRGSSTGAPGAGLRMAFAKDLRGQGSRLSTGQAEGGPHAPEEAAPPPTVGFRVMKLGRRLFLGGTMGCIKKPRCDTNEGCDIEVTVTSSEELHTLCKQAERAKRETEKR